MSSGRHFLLFLLFTAGAAAFAWFAPPYIPVFESAQTLGIIAGGFLFLCGGLIVLLLRQRATLKQCAEIMGQMNEAMGYVIGDQRRIEEQMQGIQGALSTMGAE